MVNEVMDFITAADPQVGQAIRAEYDRQQQNIELIASENIVSAAVLAAAGTVLTNKDAEGYPGKRYYGGCQCPGQLRRVPGPVPAWGHGSRHEPGPGRPPDPWLPRQFLRQKL